MIFRGRDECANGVVQRLFVAPLHLNTSFIRSIPFRSLFFCNSIDKEQKKLMQTMEVQPVGQRTFSITIWIYIYLVMLVFFSSILLLRKWNTTSFHRAADTRKYTWKKKDSEQWDKKKSHYVRQKNKKILFDTVSWHAAQRICAVVIIFIIIIICIACSLA